MQYAVTNLFFAKNNFVAIAVLQISFARAEIKGNFMFGLQFHDFVHPLEQIHIHFGKIWHHICFRTKLFYLPHINSIEWSIYSHITDIATFGLCKLSNICHFLLCETKLRKETWGAAKEKTELSVLVVKCVTLLRLLEIKTEYLIWRRAPLLLWWWLLVKSSKVVGPASCTVTL